MNGKSQLKFVYSEKATKFSTLLLTFVYFFHTEKSKSEISQNFVAFSEYMNFKGGFFQEHIFMVYPVLYKCNLTNKH